MYLELKNFKLGEKKKVNTSEMGGSGTTILDGILSDIDYKSAVSGSQRFTTYERMRKSDPAVRVCLAAIELLLQEGSWKIEGQDEKLRQFVEDAFFNYNEISWRETLHNAMLFLPFGFMVFEKVFKYEDNFVYWKKFAPRHPKTIERWQMANGKPGIVQQLWGEMKGKGGDRPEIPMEKLVVLTHEKEGDNYEGNSLLRAAYKPWFFKEIFEKIDAIGYERMAVGVPVFKMPVNPTPDDKEAAEEAGKNLRVNEKAHVILPAGWELEMLNMGSSGIKDPGQAIQQKEREILLNVMAQFLALGSDSKGSFALSRDHSALFDRSVRALGKLVCEAFNIQAVRQLVDLNFGKQKEYPELVVDNISRVDINEFSNAIERMTRVGVITPDYDTEQKIRSYLTLPEIDEEEYAQRQEEKKKEKEAMAQVFDKGEKSKEEKKTKDDREEKENQVKKGSEWDVRDLVHLNDDESAELINRLKELKKKPSLTAEEVSELRNLYEMTPRALRPYVDSITASEQGYWRPLTAAEHKVDYPVLNQKIDELKRKHEGAMFRALKVQMGELMEVANEVLLDEDLSLIALYEPQFKGRFAEILQEALYESFEYGKLFGANEVKIDAPATDPRIREIIAQKADMLAEQLVNAIMEASQTELLHSVEIGSGISEAKASFLNKVASVANLKGEVAVDISVMGGINQGRDEAFTSDEENIYAYQRSEILDSRTCKFCISVDGRVVRKGDPLLKHHVFHPHCRGIWVAILEDEVEKPEIGGVPDSLRRRMGNPFELKQPREAIPAVGTLAEDFIDGNTERD